MPLPPLPENNTDRVWLKYTSSGTGHEICWRVPSATTQADIITEATALANALKPQMLTTDAFTSLRHQDSGSNLTFPLAFTAISGTGSGSPLADDKADFVALAGRSLGGYRCRITFFTSLVNDANSFRIAITTAGPAKVLWDAVAAMTPAPVAIDGQTVIWNSYVNYGANSYWQRQFR